MRISFDIDRLSGNVLTIDNMSTQSTITITLLVGQKVLSVGIEPTTLGLLDPRSNQLSYEGFLGVIQGEVDYMK